MGKATIRRRLTSKRKVNRKNKKTQRKGKKQTGGRRRPNGAGTGGAASASASASPNNGNMNEGGPDDLSYVEKAEAIRLIQANKRVELLELLGTRTFPDDGALMTAVKMRGANMEMISEVIFRTYIHADTEDKISEAMEETPGLLIEVIDALKEQELRQEEAAALAQQEQKYANNGRVSTPPPMNHED